MTESKGHLLHPVTGPENSPQLSRAGRRLRVAATLIASAALLAGTIVGSDDDFPFGPFRMYAGIDRPDAPVPDTRVEAIDLAGTALVLTERNAGIRRAEIEGQLDRFAADPSLLAEVARGYAERNPSAPALAQVTVLIRWHEMNRGRPTGGSHDQTVATWRAVP